MTIEEELKKSMSHEEAIKQLEYLAAAANWNNETQDLAALLKAIDALKAQADVPTDDKRAEAIYVLKNTAWLGSTEQEAKVSEAVRIAVKALEQREENMTENERKTMMALADTLKGEINRMCVTKELSEFDAMYGYAKKNLETLSKMIYEARFRVERRTDG